jgi:hypothetical protein
MNIPGKKVFHDEEFLTDWMPRGGDGFILRGERIDQITTTPAMKVSIEVQTKNSEDTTNPTTGIKTLDLPFDGSALREAIFEPAANPNGVKELIRFKVSTTLGAENDWMLLRTFPLIWFEGAR